MAFIAENLLPGTISHNLMSVRVTSAHTPGNTVIYTGCFCILVHQFISPVKQSAQSKLDQHLQCFVRGPASHVFSRAALRRLDLKVRGLLY